MWLMCRLRRCRPPMSLQPEARIARTVQGPFYVLDRDGEWRVSSALFKASKSDSYCSVDLEQLLVEDGLNAETLYPQLPDSLGLVGLFVREILAENHIVRHVPVDENWYHGGIHGPLTQSVRKRLALACHVIVPINPAAVAAYAGHALTP